MKYDTEELINKFSASYKYDEESRLTNVHYYSDYLYYSYGEYLTHHCYYSYNDLSSTVKTVMVNIGGVAVDRFNCKTDKSIVFNKCNFDF